MFADRSYAQKQIVHRTWLLNGLINIQQIGFFWDSTFVLWLINSVNIFITPSKSLVFNSALVSPHSLKAIHTELFSLKMPYSYFSILVWYVSVPLYHHILRNCFFQEPQFFVCFFFLFYFLLSNTYHKCVLFLSHFFNLFLVTECLFMIGLQALSPNNSSSNSKHFGSSLQQQNILLIND